jgi:hypothetical protein
MGKQSRNERRHGLHGTSSSWFTPGEQRGSALGLGAEGFGSHANLNWPELSFWVELYVHCRFPVKAESSLAATQGNARTNQQRYLRTGPGKRQRRSPESLGFIQNLVSVGRLSQFGRHASHVWEAFGMKIRPRRNEVREFFHVGFSLDSGSWIRI